MRLLVNCASLANGGGVKRAVEFIYHIAQNSEGCEWHFVVSPSIERECQIFRKRFKTWSCVKVRPSRSLVSRRRLEAIETGIHPDAVVTFAGPAYVEYQAPHLMGWADGWVSHANSLAYSTLAPIERLRMIVTNRYKRHWAQKADGWFCQTYSARAGLSKTCNIPLSRIGVIANTAGTAYERPRQNTPHSQNGLKRILLFSTDLPHKRIEMVPDVAAELRQARPNVDFEFVLTLPTQSRVWQRTAQLAKQRGVVEYIANRGPIETRYGYRLYEQADVCFLPSVLETFSGVYAEAMAMDCPIVTTDMSFAREVCQDAASYFVPNSPKSAAESIYGVIRSAEIREHQVRRGRAVLNRLPTTEEQVRQLLQLVQQIVN